MSLINNIYKIDCRFNLEHKTYEIWYREGTRNEELLYIVGDIYLVKAYMIEAINTIKE